MGAGKCKVCGATHSACGPASTVVAVDSPYLGGERKGSAMGLKEYRVMVGNTETTMQLSDEDAKRQGVTEKDLVAAPKAKAAPAPKNKAVTATASKPATAPAAK